MSDSIFKVPASVTQNISRAKAALRKGEALRAVDALLDALNLFNPKKVVGQAKYETEILMMECVEDLNRNKQVEAFLAKVAPGKKEPKIPYVPGQEGLLASALQVLLKALREDVQETEQGHEDNREDRRKYLWDKGSDFLKNGDAPRGKAVLRRLAEEFGDEPGVYAMVGEALCEAGLGHEALDFLEGAIEQDPADSKSYGYLVRAYTEGQEYKKAERIYKLALRRFGQHYKTLINFAQMYKLWNKRDEAYDIALMALKESPGNPEAQALLDWADRK